MSSVERKGRGRQRPRTISVRLGHPDDANARVVEGDADALRGTIIGQVGTNNERDEWVTRGAVRVGDVRRHVLLVPREDATPGPNVVAFLDALVDLEIGR